MKKRADVKEVKGYTPDLMEDRDFDLAWSARSKEPKVSHFAGVKGYTPDLMEDRDFDLAWSARSKEPKVSHFAGLFDGEEIQTPCKVYKGKPATFTAGQIRPVGSVGSESDFIRLCLIRLNVTQPDTTSRNKIRCALVNAGYKSSIQAAERRLKTYEKPPYGGLHLGNGDSRLRAILSGTKDVDFSVLPVPCFDLK